MRTEIERACADFDGDKNDRDRDKPQRFEGEALCGVEFPTNAVFYQAVNRERAGEDERQPRHLAIADNQDDDGDSGEGHRNPLQWSKLFAENEDSEQNRHERVDEIPEGAFNNSSGEVRDDVKLPIHVNEDAGGDCVQHNLPIAQ